MCYHILEGLRGTVSRNDSLGDVEVSRKIELPDFYEGMSWEEYAKAWQKVAMGYKDLYLKAKALCEDYERMIDDMS